MKSVTFSHVFQPDTQPQKKSNPLEFFPCSAPFLQHENEQIFFWKISEIFAVPRYNTWGTNTDFILWIIKSKKKVITFLLIKMSNYHWWVNNLILIKWIDRNIVCQALQMLDFCVNLDHLCLILKIIWWSETWKCEDFENCDKCFFVCLTPIWNIIVIIHGDDMTAV